MKKRVQERGEYDWSAEDLIELQSQPFELIEKIYNQFGDIVISGCAVTGNRIESGVVCLGGVAMPFDGADGVVFPCYLVTEKRAVTGRYVDGLEKPISYDYKAVVSAARPEDESFVTVQSTGVEKLLKRSSDAVDNDSSNTVATSKAVSTLNKKITELASQELPKSDRIDLEDSDTLATSMAVATVNKKIKPLAQATETVLGGIKAKPRTTETLEVAIDTESGKLFADSVIDGLPVNTILSTTTESGNIFGSKWLKCDGSIIEKIDYPLLNIATTFKSQKLSSDIADEIIYDVIYGNGLFVAVGSRGIILTSSDNITWTQRIVTGGSDFYTITYGNGIFVVGGRYGSILISPDGINWTKSNLNSDSEIRKITCINGMFIAGGNKNSLLTSTDGLNWTNRISPFIGYGVDSPTIWDITYGNNLFVIVGGDGQQIDEQVAISSDGMNWTLTSKTIGRFGIRNIVYGNNLFVAICEGGIRYSSNGIDWTYIITPVVDINASIVYIDDLFLVVGRETMISYDGINWTKITISYGAQLFNATYTNGMIIISGVRSYIGTIIREYNLPTVANSYIKSLE